MKHRRGLVVAIIVVSLIVVVRGRFAVSETTQDPSSRVLSQAAGTSSLVSQELLTLPVKINLVEDAGNILTTARTTEDTSRILEQVNSIWSQADVVLETINTSRVAIDARGAGSVEALAELLMRDDSYDPGRINAYFVKTLSGANGIALVEQRMIFVADVTTVNDFRATSHEIGHILGLSHTSDNRGRLLYRGANGTELVKTEIERARRGAFVMTEYE